MQELGFPRQELRKVVWPLKLRLPVPAFAGVKEGCALLESAGEVLSVVSYPVLNT